MSASPSQEEAWAAELNNALVSKKLEWQTLSGLAAENSTLRTKISRPGGSFEMFGQEEGKVAVRTQNVPDSMANSRKLWADTEALKERNIKLASKVRK